MFGKAAKVVSYNDVKSYGILKLRKFDHAEYERMMRDIIVSMMADRA